jgi:hypothetical protein
MTPKVLCIGSYNIWHAGRVKEDVGAIGRYLSAQRADLVGLQEVDVGTTRMDGMDTLAVIAKAGGYPYYAFTKAFDFGGGGYGTAVLSRFPILDVQTVPLYSAKLEPRAFCHAVIDLGDRRLDICKIAGHTPGSVAVFDAKDQIILTGDAIGSGCGVWMQLPGSTNLQQYSQSLSFFLRWLLNKTESPQFWGGHCLQRWQSAKIPGDNPVTIGLLADLIHLLNGLLRGDIESWDIQLPSAVRAGDRACNAAFGRAEITFNPDNLR